MPMPRSRGRSIRGVLMVVHIRQDFSRVVSAGGQASVQLILDGRSANASVILGGDAQQIVNTYSTELSQSSPAGRLRRPASLWYARGSIPISMPSGARFPAWWAFWWP